MRVFCTGQTGFVGRHVVPLLIEQGHELVELTERPNTMMHLAWAGLPNYDNHAHFHNVQWQAELISLSNKLGVYNVTVAGSCLEVVKHTTPYAAAKMELHARLLRLPLLLKWVRLPYLYGEGQREGCLLPRLNAAIKNRDKQFHVAPTTLPFMHVSDAAKFLVSAMTDERPQTMNCSGALMRVADFCRQHMDEGAIELVEDYPLKQWEA